MVATQFATVSVGDLIGSVLAKQVELNRAGANIGSVLVKIQSPVTSSSEMALFGNLNGMRLLTYAGDVGWGQNFMWVSPYVGAWVDTPLTGIGSGEPITETQETLGQVEREFEDAGIDPPAPPDAPAQTKPPSTESAVAPPDPRAGLDVPETPVP